MAKQNCVNSSLTAHGIQVADAAGVGCISAVLADGELLIGSSGASPVVASLIGGTDISITPGSGSITIDYTGSGGGGAVNSIVGINGLDATDTGGGNYEVGVAPSSPQILFDGSALISAGDFVATSGEIYVQAAAIDADLGARGEIYLDTIVSSTGRNDVGNITLRAQCDNTGDNTGNVLIQSRGGLGNDTGNLSIYSTALPNCPSRTIAIQCSGVAPNPNDIPRIVLSSSGSAVVPGFATMELESQDLTVTSGNTIFDLGTVTETVGSLDSNASINYGYKWTSTQPGGEVNSYQIGLPLSGGAGHTFEVGPTSTYLVSDGTNYILWRNAETLVTNQAFIIDWAPLPTPYPEPAFSIYSSDQIGNTTLSGGTVTVTIPWVTSGMRVFATCRQVIGTPGFLEAVAGTGDITINSYDTAGVLNTADDSQVNYWVMP